MIHGIVTRNAAVAVVAILITAATIWMSARTGYTAGNVVAPSAVDADQIAYTADSALKPADCSAIPIVSLVLGVTGNGSRNLILATPADDVIDGGGARDCILAGDGDDTIDGGPGNDICIGGPGADVFIGCETQIP